jgi:hypothetical protein
VEPARLELASPGCRPGTLPLSYDPASREGIEPSLRVLEARPVTMTLRPMNAWRLVGESNPSHSMDSGAATPVASRGSRVTGGNRTHLHAFTARPRPRRVPSHRIHFVGRRGLAPRSPALQAGAITRLAHDPRFAPLGGNRRRRRAAWAGSHAATPRRSFEGRASSPLDDSGRRSPRPGSNRSLPLTRRVLVLSSYEGTRAPAEGIEPSKGPLNGRLPDHSASLE